MEEKIIKSSFHMASNFISDIIGNQMVETHSIALAEQIKNGKDAGATIVSIDFSNIESDKIIIEDNGQGMAPKNIIENWFSLGGSTKASDENMAGGKGIGRLSLFRLGDEIHFITSDGTTESQFVLAKGGDFEEIPVTLTPSTKTGTKIEIAKLDGELDLNDIEIDLKNLKSEDNDLVLKIEYPQNFKKTKFLKPSDVEKYIPMMSVVKIDFSKLKSDEIIDEAIEYSFSAQVVAGDVLYENKEILPKLKKNLKKKLKDFPENTFKHIAKLGVVNFELNNFFLDNGANPTTRTIDELNVKDGFLKVYEGINIYRNGFKIFGHGHDDWLKLAENRVSRSGKNIDNKMTYGTIYLPNSSEDILVEKTNREGFQKGNNKKIFDAIILAIVKQFGEDRSLSTPKIRNYTFPISPNNDKQDGSKREEGNISPKIPTTVNEPNSNTDKVEKINNGDDAPKINQILKSKSKILEIGTSYCLKNKELFTDSVIPEDIILPSDLIMNSNFVITVKQLGSFDVEYLYKGTSEILKLKVIKKPIKPPKHNKIGFFEDSTKFTGTVDLETIHPIVGELIGLNYNERPLIHLIALRTVLESIIQDYVDHQQLSTPKELKERIRSVVNDMIQNVKLPKKQREDPKYQEKQRIYSKFKSKEKLTALLKGIQTKFFNEAYDVFLHELTHNTSEIDERLALEIANEIILPLHVLFVEMKKEKLI